MGKAGLAGLSWPEARQNSGSGSHIEPEPAEAELEPKLEPEQCLDSS